MSSPKDLNKIVIKNPEKYLQWCLAKNIELTLVSQISTQHVNNYFGHINKLLISKSSCNEKNVDENAEYSKVLVNTECL